MKKDQDLRRLYGITLEQFKRMLEAQGGGCSVCGEKVGKLVVDHCHKTQKVRSVLCNGCNRALGYVKENPNKLRALAAYVEAHLDVKQGE